MIKEPDTMVIYVDIDETICNISGSDSSVARDYNKAVPILERIEKINNLYDEGHTIVYWTARGSLTGIDWRELTEKQLKTWGVKYHDLRLDKPYYNLFIDDKNINSNNYFNGFIA